MVHCRYGSVDDGVDMTVLRGSSYGVDRMIRGGEKVEWKKMDQVVQYSIGTQ